MAAPPPPPALMEELVEEVLLSFPADDPASLVRAALVSKRWCRIVSGRGFRRRFRERHRAATVLGVLCRMDDDAGLNNGEVSSSFVPTGSFRPRRADRCDWVALDARLGRVLLLLRPLQSTPGFVVWDPVTGEEWEVPPSPRCPYVWNGALLCAGSGGDYDHLDCRSRPFLVVLVASIGGRKTCIDVYSSEANAWTEQASVQHTGNDANIVDWLLPAGVLLGNSLYFMLRSHKEVLEYNLCTREISKIQLPLVSDRPNALTITADGRLGFDMIHNTTVYLWIREASPEGDARWAQRRVIELEKLLPAGALMDRVRVVGFVDGVSLIFLQTSNELFAIDLKSQKARKMCERHTWDMVIPYESFYTPGTVLPCF
ncbi:unnamed protein product [Urochloa decumbens]|uniref:F-box domain-containing protein n=1 Tax=Urochloa decumbens TaxID=240449 RepID=A0ABC9FNM5_9POAL